MITKKTEVRIFCIPKGPKGFHNLMVKAEECKKSNLKQLFMPLSFTVLKWLITCQFLFLENPLQEAQSMLQMYPTDLCDFTDVNSYL